MSYKIAPKFPLDSTQQIADLRSTRWIQNRWLGPARWPRLRSAFPALHSDHGCWSGREHPVPGMPQNRCRKRCEIINVQSNLAISVAPRKRREVWRGCSLIYGYVYQLEGHITQCKVWTGRQLVRFNLINSVFGLERRRKISQPR